MTQQCQHLKPCNAMAKFRKAHGDWSADVNWKHCETCPLRSEANAAPSESSSESPQRTPSFFKKTITKG